MGVAARDFITSYSVRRLWAVGSIVAAMQFKSKTIPLLVLAITAVAFSRAVFAFFRDPEGPNLVVTIGLAGVIYLPSLLFYMPKAIRRLRSLPRLILAVVIQGLVATGL